MDRPTVTDIKTWSRLDFGSLDEPFSDDDLAMELGRSCDYVTAVTGRIIDDTFPVPLVSICQEAVQMRVEQVTLQAQSDYLETVSDDQVQSFTAGSYSETRAEGSRSRARGSPQGYPMVTPMVALNERLWLLMTPEMQDYWRGILMGLPIPSFAVSEVDWGNYDGQYPYSWGVGMASSYPNVWP